jgi:predicted ester cyclase
MRSVPIVGLFIFMTVILVQADTPADAARPKIEILRRYAELGRSGQYDKQAEFWSNDAINNGRPMRPEFIRIILEDIYRTFPDYRSEIVETIELGDTVVTLSRVSGTHLGTAQTNFNGGLLKGAKPMGRRFEVLQTHWWKFRHGKIVWHQGVRDDLGMMRQIGLLPDELPASLIEGSSTELKQQTKE